MDNFYEEMYEYLISEGIGDEEATEVVNYLFEDNIHEYGLITENKGRAFMDVLKAVGYMSGVLKKSGAKQAVKATVNKITGTPLQGNLLTKTGKAQNFTGGRTPFTGTSPVPAASSKLPQSFRPPAEVPGQMKIPGTSAKAQDLRNITRNPNLGLPGNTKGFAIASPMSKPKPSGPPTSNAVGQAIRNLGKSSAPLPQPSTSKLDKVISAVKKSALPVGVAGATGLTLSGSQGSKKTEVSMPASQTPSTSRPESPPQFQGTGERSAEANAKKQEDAKANAERRRNSAKNFDAAFAAARKAGKSEFSWRGKQYNTKYKGE